MSKQIVINYKKVKVKFKSIHSKNKQSTLKSFKNYVKKYRG